MVAEKRKKSEDDPDHKIERFLWRKSDEKRLILVLEQATLEAVRINDSFQLLNSEKHIGFLKKNNRQLESARPDIVHQCLLMLLDSPLNQSGFLQVFIHTQQNVLIEVNPQTRIPRTFERFSGLMVQLLHKLHINASESGTKLMKVVKNPITSHFPSNCKKIVMSHKAEKIVNPKNLAPNDFPIVIVVGSMPHGSVNVDYMEECVSISNYPLSAALVCAKICTGFEEAWNVI